MLDISQQVVTALETTGVSVQYEMFYNGKTVPCITYMENSNADTLTGDTFGYSSVRFTVTVWATTVADMQAKAQLVDSKMRNLGFKRTASNEIVQGNLLRKVLDYKCTVHETY